MDQPSNWPPRACTKCRKVKPISEFYVSNHSNRADKHESSCKECKDKQRTTWGKNNLATLKKVYRKRFQSEKGRRVHDKAEVKAKFNIDLEVYEQMLEEQKDRCFLCVQLNTHGTPIGLDHNHETGQIRRFLCSTCNWGLESFKESPTIIRAAIEYLKKHQVK